jgi:NTE family protein
MKKYKNLVLSGGGLKGLSYIGLKKVLEEYKIDDFECYCGTSIGSIFCLLFVLGYTSKQLEKVFVNLNFENYIDIDIINFLEGYGLSDGEKIIDIFKTFMKYSLGENITFLDLWNIKKKKLIIVGSCINNFKTEYFDYINYPNMKIIDAIRISISLPPYFKYCTLEGKCYIDGGITSNIPFDLFMDNLDDTLIVRLKNNLENMKFDRIDLYLETIVRGMSTHHENRLQYLLKLDVLNIELLSSITMNFNLSNEEKKQIINYGYITSKQYLIDKEKKNIIDNVFEYIFNKSFIKRRNSL